MNKNHIGPRLLVHGGAGQISQDNLTLQEEQECHAILKHALNVGYKILSANGSSLDAVQAAINVLEDASLFNAGYGSVLTKTGKVELDASIMDGKSLKAGAIAGVSRIRNPITLAKMVLEKSEHVMLIGQQAEAFAASFGIEHIDPTALITEKQLQKWQALQNTSISSSKPHEKYGTVGAVALDNHGNLAAGTSTGGLMNKTPGRVGDSPIIGAGTYADNHTCAVSCTGIGEYFMRLIVAYDIGAQIKYKTVNLSDAVASAINRLNKFGGSGGVIALDRNGNATMLFNTEGMYRGYIDETKVSTEIY